jgi:nitrous oxidase accessory protein NosD
MPSWQAVARVGALAAINRTVSFAARRGADLHGHVRGAAERAAAAMVRATTTDRLGAASNALQAQVSVEKTTPAVNQGRVQLVNIVAQRIQVRRHRAAALKPGGPAASPPFARSLPC